MATETYLEAVQRRVVVFDGAFGSAYDADWLARARDAGVVSSMLPEPLLLKRLHSSNSFVTEENSRHLLQALRRSIQRKQDQPTSDESSSS